MGGRCFRKQRQVHKGREWDVHNILFGWCGNSQEDRTFILRHAESSLRCVILPEGCRGAEDSWREGCSGFPPMLQIFLPHAKSTVVSRSFSVMAIGVQVLRDLTKHKMILTEISSLWSA